jgi:hypothetical protein
MSTNETAATPPKDPGQCPEGQTWNEEQGKCLPDEKAASGLMGRIEGVIKDYFDRLELRMDAMLDAKMANIVKTKEQEMENALRKSFGLEKDPVVHMSDLPKLMRKLQLENTETGKTTPASPPEGTGPAGTTTLTKSARPDLAAVYKRFGITQEDA